jgi:transposase
MGTAITDSDHYPEGFDITPELWHQTPPLIRAILWNLIQQNQQLEARLTKIEAKVGKNSRNSSKPPSSDPPSVTRPPVPPSGRKQGGQPGHPGQTRMLVPIEQVDAVKKHFPSTCQHCSSQHLEEVILPNPLRQQVAEVPPVRVVITEHQAHQGKCLNCGRVSAAELPAEVANSAFGPNLQTEVALLTGRYRLSRREVVDYADQAWGLSISLGSVSNIEANVSKALAEPYQEALESVQQAPIRNVDETGWREKNRLAWIWSASTPMASVFHINRHRSREAFVEWIGEETLKHGIWIADRYGVYRVINEDRLALCHAHIRRDIVRLSEAAGVAGDRGKDLLKLHQAIFDCIEQYRMTEWSFQDFRAQLHPTYQQFEKAIDQGVESRNRLVKKLCKGLRRRWRSLWTFARVEGVDPTNNAAERSVRKGVLWRKSSLGSQSERGSRYAERMLTVTQTCQKQGRRLLDFMGAAIKACLAGVPAPSLFKPAQEQS